MVKKFKILLTVFILVVLCSLFFIINKQGKESVDTDLKSLAKRELVDLPELSEQTKKYDAFIPHSWRLVEVAEGDLNKDGQSDTALVIQKTDKSMLKVNTSLGSNLLNVNPRKIIILFQNNGKYSVVLDNENVIPSSSSEDDSCVDDMLGGLEIKNGNLQINYGFWSSCGSWGVSNNNFVFSYRSNQFKLIEQEGSYFSRANLNVNTKTYTNYVTGEINTTVTTFVESSGKEIVKRETKKIKIENLKNLAALTFKQLYYGKQD